MQIENHFSTAVASVIAAGLSSLAFGQASIVALESPSPSTSAWSIAVGVSDDGTMVLGEATQPNEDSRTEFFLWTEDTGMVGLGTLAAPGEARARAAGVSGNGRTLVGTSETAPTAGQNQQIVAVAWRRGLGMAALGEVLDSYRGEPAAASFDGSVIAGSSRFHGPGIVGHPVWWQATLWEHGIARNLGTHPGSLYSEALGVSGNGRVVVGYAERTRDEGRTAFRWTEEGGLEVLGDVPGGYHWSEARAASWNGSTIVGGTSATFQTSLFGADTRASVWTEANGWEVLPNGQGMSATMAVDVSPDGRIVLGAGRRAGTNRAFLWIDGVLVDVHEELVANNVDMSGWMSLTPTGMSADGRVIVGWGLRPSGGGQTAFRIVRP